MRKLSIGERIEKAHNATANCHFIDKEGLESLKERFKDKDTNFESFIQFIFNEGFREGMLESIKIISDPYDR